MTTTESTSTSGNNNTNNKIKYSDSITTDEEESEIYMAVSWFNGMFAMAFYETSNMELSMMPDIMETTNGDLFKSAYQHILPKLVLSSLKNYEKLLKYLCDIYRLPEEEVKLKILILPTSDFSYKRNKERMAYLELPGVPTGVSMEEQAIYIYTIIQMQNINMVKCIGALVRFLENAQLGIYLEQPGTRIKIQTLKTYSLDQILILNLETYKSLSIFSEETHPGSFRSREGVSLFGILNRCRTKVGSAMLKQWFKHPCRNIKEIKCRHDVVAFFVQTKNLHLLEQFSEAIKFTRNLTGLFKRMRLSQIRYNEWSIFIKTLKSILGFGQLLEENIGCVQIEAFYQAYRRFQNETVIKLYNMMYHIIDFEQTHANHRFTLRPGIDKKLDAERLIYNDMPDILSDVAINLQQKFPNCNVSYIPVLGHILILKKEHIQMAEDDSNLEYRFSVDGEPYYKTPTMIELDEKYGDILNNIIDIEKQYMHSLQEEILKHSNLLFNLIQIISEFDCLISMAVVARQNNYVRPIIRDDDCILIKNGRHPIQEIYGDIFVANSTSSGGKQASKIKFITGANTSGKSIYLMQIALAVFMCQVGSFVAAEWAELGIVDAIHARIKTPVESVCVQMSSFLLDINSLSMAVRLSTRHSLILLDEFGSGTEEESGASILASAIKSFSLRESDCPHCFIASHYHVIVDAQLIPERQLIQYQRTKVLIHDNEQINLFEIEDGVSVDSHALNVVLIAEVPNSIVERSYKILQCIMSGNSIMNLANDDKKKRSRLNLNQFLDLDLQTDDVIKFNAYVVAGHESMNKYAAMNSKAIDLSQKGYDLQHSDHQHNDLQHSDHQHNDLQHSDHQHNDQHNNLQHSDLRHNDLQHSDHRRVDLKHSGHQHNDQHNDLQHSDLQHNDLQHSDHRRVDLQHSDLQHNDPQHSDHQHNDLHHSDHRHNDLQPSDHQLNDLQQSEQLNDQHSDHQHSDHRHNDLQHSDHRHNDLQHNDQHNDLQHSDHRHNDLQHSDHRRNDLYHSDHRHNDLQHSDHRRNDLQHSDHRCNDLQHSDLQHNRKLNLHHSAHLLNDSQHSNHQPNNLQRSDRRNNVQRHSNHPLNNSHNHGNDPHKRHDYQ